jgi:hypothetical protein
MGCHFVLKIIAVDELLLYDVKVSCRRVEHNTQINLVGDEFIGR